MSGLASKMKWSEEEKKFSELLLMEDLYPDLFRILFRTPSAKPTALRNKSPKVMIIIHGLPT